MASVITVMKKLNVNSPVKGVGGLALDTVVGGGVSYGIGRAYAEHGDKWYGKNAARIAAGVGKIGAIAAFFLTGGPNYVSGALNAGGQAGIDAICLEAGLRHGRDKSGKKAVLIPKNQALPAGASDMTSIGALGNAPAGRGLSWDAIQELAQGH